MELFVFRHAEWERLYNCSLVQIDRIPLKERVFLPESITIIVLCAIYYVLYVPCIVSIWRRMSNTSCFRLLFFIGVLDILALWGVGFYVGWMSITGSVFCSAPVLNYWIQMFATTFSTTEMFADLFLALNRTIDLLSTRLEQILFGGKAIIVWEALIVTWGFVWFISVIPILYSSVNFGGFFFNPYAGYDVPFEQTQPFLHKVLLYSMFIVIPFIYAVFAVAFLIRLKWNRQTSIGLHTQFMIFLQVFLISLFNATAGFMYLYFQSQTVITQTQLTVAMFSVLHIHGSPPLIYLMLNRTIRQDCKEMAVKLIGKYFKVQHSSTPVLPIQQQQNGGNNGVRNVHLRGPIPIENIRI